MNGLFAKEKRITVRTKFRANESFSFAYDYLIYAAGSVVNDFGIKGVTENCCFIKEIEDVKRIKHIILENFEKASLPRTAPTERKRLLTFVVVGGGPSGVEFVGELSDFISVELSGIYQQLVQQAEVVLLNSGACILGAFDEALQNNALESLRSRGVKVRLNSRVTEVDSGCIKLVQKSDSQQQTQLQPFGLCVWAAGTAPRPLTKQVAETLGEPHVSCVKKSGRLAVDRWLRLKATNLFFTYWSFIP